MVEITVVAGQKFHKILVGNALSKHQQPALPTVAHAHSSQLGHKTILMSNAFLEDAYFTRPGT